MAVRLTTPLAEEDVRALRAGEQVRLSGTVYTARDAAHRMLCERLDAGTQLPVELAGQVIYFAGPAPAKPGMPIGSAGPTTSSRMDPYAPRVIAATGLRALIGKGPIGPEVVEAIGTHGCVYLAATGGAAALIARSITACEVVWGTELGPEGIHRLTVRDFPATVAVDCAGRDAFAEGRRRWSTDY